MSSDRSPFARLAECEQTLREEHDFTTEIQSEDELVFVDADVTDEQAESLLKTVAQAEFNLHVFTHEGRFVVTTVPKEIAEAIEVLD